jgi:cytosine/adenosine deaminase-related metal-dependent hydrolase
MFKNEEHLFMFADLFDMTELNKHRQKLLTVRQVLELATIGGARANRLDHKIGTLTPGKEADMILLDTRQINLAPLNNATGAVVLGMNCCDVDSVLIAGKFVKRDGRLVGVNVDQLRHRAQVVHDALMARNGRPSFVL